VAVGQNPIQVAQEQRREPRERREPTPLQCPEPGCVEPAGRA
jgi:hypothetical protein